MYQQLWEYKVEEKLYLGVREQKRLNTNDLEDWKNWAFTDVVARTWFGLHSILIMELIDNLKKPHLVKQSVIHKICISIRFNSLCMKLLPIVLYRCEEHKQDVLSCLQDVLEQGGKENIWILRRIKSQEVWENCVVRNPIIWNLHQ
jgi:hypothetical protein